MYVPLFMLLSYSLYIAYLRLFLVTLKCLVACCISYIVTKKYKYVGTIVKQSAVSNSIPRQPYLSNI